MGFIRQAVCRMDRLAGDFADSQYADIGLHTLSLELRISRKDCQVQKNI